MQEGRRRESLRLRTYIEERRKGMLSMQGFGARLRQLRLEQNYNQSHIAQILGCTVSSVSSYESEQRTPSFDVLVTYARLFHVTTDYLLGLDPIKPAYDGTRQVIDVTGVSHKDITAIRTLVQSLRDRADSVDTPKISEK